jgi:hypothetical protein
MKFCFKKLFWLFSVKVTIIYLFFIYFSRNNENPTSRRSFNFFLNEPCMIINLEQNNDIEGTYLSVNNVNIKDSTIQLKLPKNFFITRKNISKWQLGWGSEIPLFDSGVENIRKISWINHKKGTIRLGEILRGKGWPKKNQRIVFWNNTPNNFRKITDTPVLNTKLWPGFSGTSVHFSSIEFDSVQSKYFMFFNECDTSKINIYVATSKNLINWTPENKGKPILTNKDFKNCIWAKNEKPSNEKSTPFISETFFFNKKWHLFFHGYDSNGKRHIGLATSKNILGPYKVRRKAILSPSINIPWSESSVYYPKISKFKDGFVMFYAGENKYGNQGIGMATSKNLINWENNPKNPVIVSHFGWRSVLGCTEPTFIKTKGDTIYLMIAGAKIFKMGFWHHYISRRMYMDKSGNVDDTQLGVYMSTNKGKNFLAHKNNPVFINDYGQKNENEHLGGNFKYISNDTAEFIIYQAKSSNKGLKYNIMIRMRKKYKTHPNN